MVKHTQRICRQDLTNCLSVFDNFAELVIKVINSFYTNNPAGVQLFIDNNENWTMCEIYSVLTIKTPERRHWRRSVVFIVNFEQISLIVKLIPLLTLNK